MMGMNGEAGVLGLQGKSRQKAQYVQRARGSTGQEITLPSAQPVASRALGYSRPVFSSLSSFPPGDIAPRSVARS